MYDQEGRLRAMMGGGRAVFLDPQQLEHTRVQRHMYHAEWVEELPTAGRREGSAGVPSGRTSMLVWVPFSSSGMDSTWGQALAKGMLSQEGDDGVECITTVDPRETHELLATTPGLGHVVLVCENADNTIGSNTQGDAHQVGHVAGPGAGDLP